MSINKQIRKVYICGGKNVVTKKRASGTSLHAIQYR